MTASVTKWWSITALASFLVFLALFKYLYPVDMIQLTFDQDLAYLKAEAYLEEIGIPFQNLSHKTLFQSLDQNFAYLKDQVGSEQAKKLVKTNSISMGQWVVFWYEADAARDGRVIQVLISPHGEVLGFSNGFTEPYNQSLNEASAMTVAKDFLSRFHQIQLPEKNRETEFNQREGRYQITWYEPLSPQQTKPTPRNRFELTLTGRDISSFRKNLDLPNAFQVHFQKETSLASMLSFIRIILAFLVLFVLFIIFLSKYHQGEIGLRYGARFFWVVLVLSIISTLNQISTISEGITFGQLSRTQTTLLILLFSLFFFVLATAVLAFLSWTVGESEIRAQSLDRQLLRPMDALLHGKWFNQEVAGSIIWGYVGAFIILGILSLAGLVNTKVLDGWTAWGFPLQGNQLFTPLTSFQITLGAVVTALSGAILGELLYRLFILSYLLPRLKSRVLAIVICSLCFTITDVPGSFFPNYLNYITSFSIGIFLCILYLRAGLLSTMSAMFVYYMTAPIVMLLTSDNPYLWLEGLVLIALVLTPAFISILGTIKKQPFDFKPDTTPAHIKRLTHRVRISKELEIAKEVQMSMLPWETPDIHGLDIAGRCIPALEVGGDYFDYVPLSPDSLGLAIGDVSGKGVPAAIYMTLTKGVLLSYAQMGKNPGKVLAKVNQLLFRNMKRGHFVSMIYAIFDRTSRKMTFVRAGHNPIIVIRHSSTAGVRLESNGMALGLDSGELFDSTLQIKEMDFEPGDTFVFYTDGLSEAMNRNRELFGEDNLLATISKYNSDHHAPAKHILDSVFDDVKTFLGHEAPTDDMTMVVVKILE